MQPMNAAASAASSAETPTTISPDLVQQLLEHDYLKLKIKTQVDELVNAKLTRWRAGLLTAASGAFVILGYLGVQANQAVSEARQKIENEANQAHEAQVKVEAAKASAEAAYGQVAQLLNNAEKNVENSQGLVSSSQGFVSTLEKQIVQQGKDITDQRDQITTMLREAMDSKNDLNSSAAQVNQVLSEVKPLVPTMREVHSAVKEAKNAGTEARKAGTFEIVFLESNSDRTIFLPDYADPQKRYRVRFTTNKIKARASLDVTPSIPGGEEFPVQHLANLIPGEVRTIEHTSLQVEVSALRHHKQPFLHSFLILRVISTERAGQTKTHETKVAKNDLKAE